MIWDDIYSTMVRHILANGIPKASRGYATHGVFDYHYILDASQLPVLTTKKIAFKNVVSELLWFIKGRTDVEWLHQFGNHIWDEWSDGVQWATPESKNFKITNGKGHTTGMDFTLDDLQNAGFRRYHDGRYIKGSGNVDAGYGRWWRNFNGFDQIAWILDTLKTSPESRRMVVSAWNPPAASRATLPPCHDMWIINVLGGRLNLSLTQRSADVGLGVPFNTTSYCLLMHLLSLECGIPVGTFGHTLIDCHIYDNHREGLLEQLERTPMVGPNVTIENRGIFDLEPDDIRLIDYKSHPAIRLPVAI